MPSAAPLELTGLRVLSDWIDYNGHMNVGYYAVAFDKALDLVCDRLDIGAEYVRRTNGSIFVLESHATYRRELLEGDPLRFAFQLLDADGKRFHFFMTMHHAEEDYLAATSEQLAIHVDLEARRSAPFPPDVHDRLQSLLAAHRGLPRPAEAGRVIALPRKPAA